MKFFCDGYESGLRGEDPRLCPHEKMTREWDEWQRGHAIGCKLFLALGEEVRADNERKET